MRFVACALLIACGPAEMLDDSGMFDGGTTDGGTMTDGGSDAGNDAGHFDPSPANVGWIGGACASASDCTDVTGAICLTGEYPNGMCTQPCTGLCPDRGGIGDTLTFCVDGIPHGESEGICASRCDPSVLPPDGCPEGYRCVPHNRYGEPATVIDVCVPMREPTCPDASDELVPLDYPDRGMVWIPAEAACEPVDLVVMLHGINPSSNPTPSLGGGRHLELLVRQLIDAHLIRPLVLAEPVHFQGSSTFLYGTEFDPVEHLTRVRAILEPRGVLVSSLSYVGHSGAGCDSNNGLYEVLARLPDLVPAFAPTFRLWGLMDTCYAGSYHYDRPLAVLSGQNVVIASMFTSGDSVAAIDAFETGLLGTPAPLACNDAIYGRCVRDPGDEAWCSYRTSGGVVHDTNPYFYFREVLPQVFSRDPAVQPCR